MIKLYYSKIIIPFFLIAILLQTIAYGQEIKLNNYKGYFIGIIISPEYCYRHISSNDETISDKTWSKLKNISDSICKPTFGLTTGINFIYQKNNRFSLETGILYSRKGYETIPILTVDNNLNSGLAKNYSYFHYLDIPIKMNYTFIERKLQIYTSVGLIFNFLLKSTYKIVPENPTMDFKTQTGNVNYTLNVFNFSPTFGLGLKYNINEKIFLKAEPVLQYAISNTNEKSLYYTHLWSVGFNLGILFRIRH